MTPLETWMAAAPAFGLALTGVPSPGTLFATLSWLAAPGGSRKTAAFLAGQVGTYTALSVFILQAARGLGPPGAGALAPDALQRAQPIMAGVLGVVLLAAGLNKWSRAWWRGRRAHVAPGDTRARRATLSTRAAATPGQPRIPWRAALMGLVLPVLNVKNLGLFTAASLAAADAAVPHGVRVTAAAAAIAGFTAATWLPLLALRAGGPGAAARLARMRAWLMGRGQTWGAAAAVGLGLVLLAYAVGSRG